jgi:hypothetical protein
MKPMADKEVVCGRSGPGRSKSDFERGPKTGPQNDPKTIPIKLAKVRKPQKKCKLIGFLLNFLRLIRVNSFLFVLIRSYSWFWPIASSHGPFGPLAHIK